MRERESSRIEFDPAGSQAAILTVAIDDRVAEIARRAQAGNLVQAEALARELLAHDPDRPEVLCLLGDILLRSGRFDAATGFFRRGIELRPDNAEAHVGLGNARFQLKEFEAAAIRYRHALALKPAMVEAAHNLASCLHALGRSTEAAAQFEATIALNPAWPIAHASLGKVNQALGRNQDAIACFRRALQLQPDAADALANLGVALKSEGRNEEAEACLRRAIDLQPRFVDPHNSLGSLLQSQGRREEAIALFERGIEIDPTRPELHNNLGNALKERGDLDGAVGRYHRALKLRPDFAQAHSNLGNALQVLGQFEAACASYHRALEIDPRFDVAWSNLGNAARELGRLEEAERAYRRALSLNTGNVEALNNLASVLKDGCRFDEALACLRRALALKPDFETAYHNLLMIMQYDPTISPGQLLDEHREFDRRFAAGLAPAVRRRRNLPEPDRRLRVGYVSGDFGRHPVGYFMTPVLQVHDHDEVEIFAYSDRIAEDEMTRTLREACDSWRQIVDLDDASLASRLVADGIDILIDLSGHTPRNRLLAFARKPAPVQATWAGYVGTTGMAAMDYLIADERQMPSGSESEAVERIVRLPNAYVCYHAPAYAPEVGELPALQSGRVTFGCFNNLSKVNEAVIALWARLLKRLPQTQLVLKTMQLDDAALRERYAGLFAAQDIDPARVSLRGRSRHRELLAEYGQIDIALDPFPYSGGLTTLESLWMGVPVVTRRGDRFAGRHSTSHLTAVGLPELVATDAGTYLDIACGLASDLDRLAALRRTLRQRMAASPLCDGQGFVRGLEAVYRQLWRQWCEGQAAA
jgi:predicted O-linked N-acetylglucosamine transferase (SPINDLY family)